MFVIGARDALYLLSLICILRLNHVGNAKGCDSFADNRYMLCLDFIAEASRISLEKYLYI